MTEKCSALLVRTPMLSHGPNFMENQTEKTQAGPLCSGDLFGDGNKDLKQWRIRIADCFCEYEYTLTARVSDVAIADLYELVRERLKADDVHGRFVDPEEYSSPSVKGQP